MFVSTFSKLYEYITQGFLGLRMRHFQGILYKREHIAGFSNLH